MSWDGRTRLCFRLSAGETPFPPAAGGGGLLVCPLATWLASILAASVAAFGSSANSLLIVASISRRRERQEVSIDCWGMLEIETDDKIFRTVKYHV